MASENIRATVSNELERKIRTDARAAGKSKSEFITRILEEYYDDKPVQTPLAMPDLDKELQDLWIVATRLKESIGHDLSNLQSKVNLLRKHLNP